MEGEKKNLDKKNDDSEKEIARLTERINELEGEKKKLEEDNSTLKQDNSRLKKMVNFAAVISPVVPATAGSLFWISLTMRVTPSLRNDMISKMIHEEIQRAFGNQ